MIFLLYNIHIAIKKCYKFIIKNGDNKMENITLIQEAKTMIEQGLDVDCLVAKKMQLDLNNATQNNNDKQEVDKLTSLRLKLKEIHQENINAHNLLQKQQREEKAIAKIQRDKQKIKKEKQEESDPKIKINGCNYQILKAITKTHFKKLMKLNINTIHNYEGTKKAYDWKTKTGTVKDIHKDDLQKLAVLINKSSSKRAETSYEKAIEKKAIKSENKSHCEHEDLGSLGYKHGTIVKCPNCGEMAEVW
jgi:hypothetical protein